MDSISSLSALRSVAPTTSAAPQAPARGKDDQKLRQAFSAFVGETFYAQMLQALRKTQGKPAYFYGGRAEEIFRGQLDQVLAQKMAETDGDKLSTAMYELYRLAPK